MEHGARTRLTTAIILLVVFGSGVMLGLAADSSLRAEAPPEVAEVPTPDSSEAAEESRPTQRRYIYQQVDPNETQLARIDSIITAMRADRQALDEELEEFRVRWDAERRELTLAPRQAIKGVLSPEQAAEYQRLLDEWDARREAERENEDDQD
mgnify:FL=1